MKPGEGLVGEIMRQGRPINLSDAPANPHFSYHPETGEDPYHAFLGVPLLRGGRAIGVLVVQNRTERTYDEDEVEDLQTIAMVLAEMVAAGEVIGQAEFKGCRAAAPPARAAEGHALRRRTGHRGGGAARGARRSGEAAGPTTPATRPAGWSRASSAYAGRSTTCWTAPTAW